MMSAWLLSRMLYMTPHSKLMARVKLSMLMLVVSPSSQNVGVGEVDDMEVDGESVH